MRRLNRLGSSQNQNISANGGFHCRRATSQRRGMCASCDVLLSTGPGLLSSTSDHHHVFEQTPPNRPPERLNTSYTSLGADCDPSPPQVSEATNVVAHAAPARPRRRAGLAAQLSSTLPRQCILFHERRPPPVRPRDPERQLVRSEQLLRAHALDSRRPTPFFLLARSIWNPSSRASSGFAARSWRLVRRPPPEPAAARLAVPPRRATGQC